MLLEHQIAGHSHGFKNGQKSSGMLKHLGEGYVLKPVPNDKRGKREIKFYEDVFLRNDRGPHSLRLRNLVPRFIGLHQFISDNDSVNYFIKLEDVAAGCQKPCVADIKIGRQTWDPEALPEKRLAENLKYQGTKESLGFCIPGIFVNEIEAKRVVKLDKRYGRALDTVTVRDALRAFLNGTLTLDRLLVADFLRQLHAIRLWFEEQRLYLFYATSLLLVYDAESLETGKPRQVRVKMIDFAHVYPADGSADSNYLHGLTNLIQILEDLYREAKTRTSQ